MASINHYYRNEISKKNALFSMIRQTVEPAFYTNTVTHINNREQAYHLAENAKGTIVTDLPILEPEKQGLPSGAKILVFNDGEIVGRTSAARKIIGQPGVDENKMAKIVREAVYHLSRKETLTTDVIVGLNPKFTIKSHLLVPKGYENNLLSYLLNFQEIDIPSKKIYEQSTSIPVSDILVIADPEWQHPEYPYGLVLFDPLHNTAVILGLRYFGELKKGTLTLAWASAHRNGFIACHGGMKQYTKLDGSNFTMAAFGLSGSGKSTITLAKNESKYKVTVLHDDAFVISEENGITIALEPAYFDKTQDYPLTHPSVEYFLTCQNVGVTLDNQGKKVIVTEDIRNGNGRTVKSKLVTPNRVDCINEKIDAIFWIMKDDSLPPVLKIEDPKLAAIFGLTLATKRSTAENIVEATDLDQIVIEPFANPFRAYPLSEDFNKFTSLFASKQTSCYILNTGHFNNLKIKPEHTLSAIESIVDGSAKFTTFGPLEKIYYLPSEKFEPDFTDPVYLNKLKARMQDRLDFIIQKKAELDGYNALPDGIEKILQLIINNLK
ncbi:MULTISPECIES: phosphoenolpyruvate carboxykinase (ATP) [unclassified Enterococcus]|uniref:phosphoenolpyruvate carboxykinase (ATP) n=1 Tax=unclassified Enterococcus TaxID=2608891 RepID=UPI0015524270|nr:MULTISPECIES: phosphoenolpyruvate carboxykinase (ATP) [unclassified Enterococcus]MBS7578414.1 phosphoenolpyruvate carboxykinase (ATP) [Enterococcus sp. MMGLQ5-2]MBS7585645.1 phosphoenolpyruvate carboxykinase (ATP) [Enterococcus sp. MMGLQ5-1]NPD13504.1 phosphoenolpyruvate carboxykinase (ATP) [Enterococcus sp. MMGLQ5-1]NPD38246.1 phosphoenolpyruvate carboxykinase (ATP) [Enterococcus sp. MMGLQ5-2]